MFRRLLVLATVAAALGACTKDNPAFVEPEGACATGEFYVRQEFRLADPQKLDVLFVIDNTPGMTAAQTAFAESVPTLIAGLQARGIELTEVEAVLAKRSGQSGLAEKAARVTDRRPPDL